MSEKQRSVCLQMSEQNYNKLRAEIHASSGTGNYLTMSDALRTGLQLWGFVFLPEVEVVVPHQHIVDALKPKQPSKGK